jgi:cyclic pyranopterin phosphate synthase
VPHYFSNLLKLTRGNRDLASQIAVYYVTMQCNLNCAYCEDFGSRRNGLVMQNPPLEDAKKILRVIRSGFSRLWITGGEPLAHPQILELLSYARNELKFREISLITNGTLLSEGLKVDKLERSNLSTFKPSNLLTLLDRLINVNNV